MDRWGSVLVVAVVVAAAIATPRGRRLLVVVPLGLLAIGVIVVLDRGSDVWVSDTASAAREGAAQHCAAADRLSADGLLEEAQDELADALSPPVPPGLASEATRACEQAAARIAAGAADEEPEAAAAQAGSSTTSSSITTTTTTLPVVAAPDFSPPEVPVDAAAADGVEEYVDGALDVLLLTDEDDFELSGWDWLLLSLLGLVALAAWTRLVFAVRARWVLAGTSVQPVVEARDDKEDVKAKERMALEIRGHLHAAGIRPRALPQGSVAEEVPKLVEGSELQGAKVVVAIWKVVHALFGAERTYEVSAAVADDRRAIVAVTEQPSGVQRELRSVTVPNGAPGDVEILLARQAAVVAHHVVLDGNRRVPAWQEMSLDARIAYHAARAAEGLGGAS